MDAMVTARVPKEIREQGTEVLRELNATTTDLVNAAFRYVILERKLPAAGDEGRLKPGKRVLSDTQAEELDAFLRATAPARVPEDACPFEDLLEEAMGDRYADLSRH